MERRPNGRAADSRRAAEENAAGWLRYWGHADAVVIPAESGVAVRSKNALAQVRFEAYDIDQPDLQQLVGARRLGKESLFFFTGSGFSTAATEYADLMGICLVKYDLSGAVLPLNAPAGRIAVDRRRDWALRHRELTRLATAMTAEIRRREGADVRPEKVRPSLPSRASNGWFRRTWWPDRSE